jgi:hypothetical protein
VQGVHLQQPLRRPSREHRPPVTATAPKSAREYVAEDREVRAPGTPASLDASGQTDLGQNEKEYGKDRREGCTPHLDTVWLAAPKPREVPQYHHRKQCRARWHEVKEALVRPERIVLQARETQGQADD